MGLLDRIVGVVEDRIGVTVQPVAAMESLRESAIEFQAFRDEAAELAYSTLDYFSGRPQEMRPERRQRLAQRSRIAFGVDPLAGREVEMLADFAFGKGIGKPQAKDDRVQAEIDAAWTDPMNVDELTGFEAQRTASNDLRTQANLFAAAFVKGGRVRVGWLDADNVTDIVPDPEYRRRPIYYIGRTRKFKWNVDQDRPEFADEMSADGRPKVKYFAHWRNLEDCIEERKTNDGLEPLPVIPPDKLGDGLIYHVKINRLGEQQFGMPPFARSLRFYSAMNQFTEARVSMAQAAATFIARRSVKGSQSTVSRAAQAVLVQAGELGAARNLSGDPGQVAEEQRAWGPGQTMPRPGSWFTENESSKLESLALNSGAGNAVNDAQIIRAPIAASSGFGQHYLGDASNANLATATTLELPVLMMIGAWQQTFEQLYRWFTDLVIQEAVRAGKFGGIAASADAMDEGGKPLQELSLFEKDDRAEAEKRTGLDLSYTFEMPYPGRRDLPEVTTSVTAVAEGYDPTGTNVALRRALLQFYFRQGLGIDDSSSLVDDILPADAKPEPFPAAAQQAAAAEGARASALAQLEGGPGGKQPTSGEGSQYGEQRQSTPADQVAEAEWLPPDLRSTVGTFADTDAALFAESVAAPGIIAALALSPAEPVAA